MIVTLLIASVLLGVILGKYYGERERLAKSLLILSAGFLITVCLNEVFPQVYASGHHHIGLWVIGGVLLQMILENLTKGFEHGHFHHSGKGILPLGLIIGMFIHAFIEGIPLSNETQVGSPYLQGILFHNLPISFVLGAFLFGRKKPFRTLSWVVVVMFALASPLGLYLGNYFHSQWQPYFLALVGGIFLHISSVIIFESNKNHNVDWAKMGLVVLGVGLAMLGHLFHHH